MAAIPSAAPARDALRLQELDPVICDLQRANDENRRAISLLFQAVEALARRHREALRTAAPQSPASAVDATLQASTAAAAMHGSEKERPGQPLTKTAEGLQPGEVPTRERDDDP